MAVFFESVRSDSAYPHRGGIRIERFGICLLKLLKLLEHHIILVIGYLRAVVDIVEHGMMRELFPEIGYSLFGPAVHVILRLLVSSRYSELSGSAVIRFLLYHISFASEQGTCRLCRGKRIFRQRYHVSRVEKGFDRLCLKLCKQFFESILTVKAGVDEPAAFIVPLGQAAVVIGFFRVLDEERH